MEIFEKYYKVNAHTLVDDLAKKFKFRGLDDKKVSGQYFLCCPFHNNGQERTASANFSLVNKGKAKEGDFWCFACHTGGHISHILTKLFGDKKSAEEWVEKTYGSQRQIVEDERRELRQLPTGPREESKPEEKIQVFKLRTDAYKEKTDYYAKRGIPDELVDRFKLGYIPSKRCVYMPVFDSRGQVVFFQTRNIDNKSFYLPVGAKKVIWGANNITGPEVVVCESIFNALTVIKNGFQAVALFGTGDDNTYHQLLELPCRSFVLALDTDAAGAKGIRGLSEFLRKQGKLVSTVFIPEAKKDLNDYAHLSHEEFMEKWTMWKNEGFIRYGKENKKDRNSTRRYS